MAVRSGDPGGPDGRTPSTRWRRQGALAVWQGPWQGKPLVWPKTEHEYPTQAVLERAQAEFGEVLVSRHYVTEGQLDDALAAKPEGMRLGEYLVQLGRRRRISFSKAFGSSRAFRWAGCFRGRFGRMWRGRCRRG